MRESAAALQEAPETDPFDAPHDAEARDDASWMDPPAPRLPPASPALERQAAALAVRFDPNIKRPGWNVWHGGAKAAAPYAVGYWRAALGAAHLLEHAPATSLDHALQALGKERRELAKKLGSEDAHLFGKYLDPAIQGMNPQFASTPIAGSYLKLAHVAEFADRLKRGDTAAYGDALVTRTRHGERAFYFQEALPGGDRMFLSSITEDEKGALEWQHALFTPTRLAHLEHLFSQAQAAPPAGLSPEARLDHVCERVGKLHYFLAHCCPFKRGSAAVSDMLTSAILHNQGYLHAGWRDNVSADVVALVTPSSDVFAKQYRSLMAPGPTPR